MLTILLEGLVGSIAMEINPVQTTCLRCAGYVDLFHQEMVIDFVRRGPFVQTDMSVYRMLRPVVGENKFRE